MNLAKSIISATALTAVLAVSNAGTLHAADAKAVLSMKPMHGISFELGTKPAVSYFSSDNGQCKLVLTVAEQASWDDVSAFQATRFEATIPAGKATRFSSTEGNTLEFACQAGAQSMTVKVMEQIATDGRQ
jgi:hypothetical protein